MWTSKRQTALARLMMVGAFVCGFMGLTVGIVDRSWKLGVIGWFAGGTLLAVLAVTILVDSYRSALEAAPSVERTAS